MATKKTSPASSKKSKRPTGGKKRPKPAVPKLPEVAPELKEHIVKPAAADNYFANLAWIGAVLLGILITTGSTMWLVSLKQPRPQATTILPVTETPLLTATAPLTGLPTTEAIAPRRPWAVVVENFVTVRPQSGLSAADIVFESPTEGGITRLVAIYQSRFPTLIGPIRSARSFFNAWIRPLAPFYSHSGGSDLALQQLRAGYGDIIDINEFYHGAAYSREASYKAPHNLFTTPERFFNYLSENDYELISQVPKLTFTAALPLAPLKTELTLPYLPQEYEVTYIYQPSSGTYQRLVDGTTQFDATSNQVLTVKNVVALFTDIDPIPGDPLLRINLRTLGTGTAQIFTGGRVYTGSWRKVSPDSPLEFVDEAGAPLPLQPGTTWISVLDSAQTIVFSADATSEPELQ